MSLYLSLFFVVVFTICARRTLNVLAGFFIFLMWVGYLITIINISIGVVFVLIYISAIAVVLISVVLAIGANISGSRLIDYLFILSGPLFLLTSFNSAEPLLLFPSSMSSVGLYDFAGVLLVSQAWLTLLLSVYFFAVGLFITGSFYKSLYKKTNSGLRGLTLNNVSSTQVLTYL